MEKDTLKDIRLSLYLIIKDLNRLADDVKCLSEYIEKLEKERKNETMAQGPNPLLA